MDTGISKMTQIVIAQQESDDFSYITNFEKPDAEDPASEPQTGVNNING